MLRTILFLAYFSFSMQVQQLQSASSTPKPKMPLAPLAPLVPLVPLVPKPKSYIMITSPIPREKQLVIVPKEDDIRRKMWDTANSAAATTAASAAARGRLAELAKLASPTPRPSINEDQGQTDMRIPMFLIFLIFAFCIRRSTYKFIRSHLLKYNKNLEIRRTMSHELYAIGVKEEVRHNLQLQHHPLIRSRTNLSKGDLSV